MGQKFKKIMSVAGSMFMVGATIGMAAAAGGAFPSPFVKDSNADYAIVYGANAAASDVTGANSLNTYLNTFYSSDITDTTKTVVTGDFSSSVSITNDEIELGSNTIIGSDLRTTIEDNKLSTDTQTSEVWNDLNIRYYKELLDQFPDHLTYYNYTRGLPHYGCNCFVDFR